MSASRTELAAVIGLLLVAHVAHAQGSPPKKEPPRDIVVEPGWNTLLADTTTSRYRIDADGKPIGPVATARQHIERTRTNGWWSTSFTVFGPEYEVVNAPKQTKPSRIEDPGNDEPIRFYDGEGRQVGELPAPPRRVSPHDPGTEDVWIDAFIVLQKDRGRRLAALERRYGKTVGRLNNFDRYVSRNPHRTAETLVESDLALPVEINVVEAGALALHAAFTYAPAGGGIAVRTRAVTESRLPNGQRAVVETVYSNVRLERR